MTNVYVKKPRGCDLITLWNNVMTTQPHDKTCDSKIGIPPRLERPSNGIIVCLTTIKCGYNYCYYQ